MDELKEWYNGCSFRGEKVYNPFSILHYLKNKEFQNYWFETGTPSFLIKLIEKRKFSIPELEDIELSKEILDSFDINSIQLETLLFQTGYLTIGRIEKLGDMHIYHMGYPNKGARISQSNSVSKFLANIITTEKERNKSRLYKILLLCAGVQGQ